MSQSVGEAVLISLAMWKQASRRDSGHGTHTGTLTPQCWNQFWPVSNVVRDSFGLIRKDSGSYIYEVGRTFSRSFDAMNHVYTVLNH